MPRVFVATLRANGYDVVTARDGVGAASPDADLLEYCRANDRILITNDKKDFGQYGSSQQTHSGIVIYTSPSSPQ